MGKKVKKHRRLPDQKNTSSASHHQQDDSLQVLKAVTCRKTGGYVLLGDCLSCQHHNGMRCEVDRKNITIRTIPYMTPSMVNRHMVENTTTSLHDTILNYYVYTNICSPVNNIKDEAYHTFRTKFMRGELFVEDNEVKVVIPEALEPIAFLKNTDGDKEGIWTLDGVTYGIASPYDLEGEIKKVYWLYEIFENEGLADIQFSNSFFCVRTVPIKDYGEDMVVAVYDKGAIIGRRK